MDKIDVTDVREMVPEQKRQVLRAWFDLNMTCPEDNFGGGHKWISHNYVDELHVWVWKCGKCRRIRICSPLCNDIWVISSRYCKALIVTDDFADPKKMVREALRQSHLRTPSYKSATFG